MLILASSMPEGSMGLVDGSSYMQPVYTLSCLARLLLLLLLTAKFDNELEQIVTFHVFHALVMSRDVGV